MKARGEPAPEDMSIAAHLLRIRDPVSGAPLPDDLLAGEFGVFFLAGVETSGNTIAWTLCAWDLLMLQGVKVAEMPCVHVLHAEHLHCGTWSGVVRIAGAGLHSAASGPC